MGRRAVSIKFESGQRMPVNALAALRFAGRVGFLTRGTWGRYFARGGTRWQRVQLGKLVAGQYLRPHANPQGHDVFVLSDKGRSLVERNTWSYVRPTPIGQVGHDEVVAHSILELDRAGVLQRWAGERELARDGARSYSLSKKDQPAKYPDAVLRVEAFGKSMLMALEYERQRKAVSRYQSVVRAYAGMSDFSMILFVCETETIRKTIEGVVKAFAQTPLAARVAFVEAEEWKTSPLTAAISIRSGTIRLGEVCARNDASRAA